MMPRFVSHVLAGAVYHPPDSDSNEMISLIMYCLDNASKKYSSIGILLLGDFNQLPDEAIERYPLFRVVKEPTRGNAVLDKIFTNIAHWYGVPTILPPVDSSNNKSVMLQSVVGTKYNSGNIILCSRRIQGNNSKMLLATALNNMNWVALYRMESVNDMVSFLS